VFGSQTRHHPGEDILIALTIPTVVQRLMRPIGGWGITPTSAIAIDGYYPTGCTPIINARFTVGLWEKGRKARHPHIRELEKIRHVHRSFSNRKPCPYAEINGS
jgi:hypothetical protein